MCGLCRELRDLGRSPSSGFLFVSPGVIASVKGLRTEDLYVCVSSGTAEMRAAWFLLTALGMLRAKLLQVGSTAYPLFGDANVREVQMDTTDWATIRQLVMPSQYFGDRVTTPPTLPRLGSNRGRLKQATTNDPKLQELLTGAHPLPTSKDANLAETGTFQVPGCISEERFTSLVPGLDEALQEMGIYVGSATLRHAAERAGIAAGSHLPVLLLGETGTGKERFAHLIHRLSPRCRNDVVAINCAAIPKELAESYLFGHMKGAFTGAISDKKGMFEHADQSTLFLDEIAELTLEVQAKLLRVIQDGAVHRVGSMTPRKADVRIIAATNRDLRNEVAAGRFREDLYFRLEVVQIKLPALRDRRNEIPELALMLLKHINQRRQKPRQLTKEALRCLEDYAWPGNVRQLSNVLERSALYAQADVMDANDLLITDDSPERGSLDKFPEPSQGFSLDDFLTNVREQLFLRALEKSKGNQAEAAALLGVSRQAVSKFMAARPDNAS